MPFSHPERRKAMTKLIADISHYVTVEYWKKIKETCPFLICKATQGIRIVDSYLDAFIKGCESNHIPYWLYTYIEYATDGTAQAKYLIDKTKDKVGSYFIGYAVDAEVNSEKSSRVEIRGKLPEESEVRKAIMYIKNLGGKCMFYGNDYLSLIKEIRDENCAIWYPRYGKDTGEYDPAYPVKKTYEPYADMHQYTSKGTCPGLSAECDLNRLTGKRDLSWFTTRGTKEEEKKLTEKDITIVGHGSGRPSKKNMYTYSESRHKSKAPNGKRKGIVCVLRYKGLTDKQREAIKAAYAQLINRNIYNQSLRSYVFTKHKDGKYYSDCSSSVMASIAKGIGKSLTLLNTAGMYYSDLFEKVPVEIKNGHITNPEVLREIDCIMYAGTDPSRPLQIGHVEMIYSIPDEKEGYTGEWPKLPARGWFKNGDVSAEVCKLKEFLNWFGDYGLTETNKNYLSKTVAAVKDFQTKVGITVDGEFGSKSLAAAKKAIK